MKPSLRKIYVDFRELEEADDETTATLHYGGQVIIHEQGKPDTTIWGVGTDRGTELPCQIRDTLESVYNLEFSEYESFMEHSTTEMDDPFFLNQNGDYIEITAFDDGQVSLVIGIKPIELDFHPCQCTCGNEHFARNQFYPHETWDEK